MTPGLLKADRTAEGFAGLPDGVTSPGQLLAALKAAAPRLCIAPRLVHAVVYTLGIPVLRTLAFAVGFVAQAALVVAIFANL